MGRKNPIYKTTVFNNILFYTNHNITNPPFFLNPSLQQVKYIHLFNNFLNIQHILYKPSFRAPS